MDTFTLTMLSLIAIAVIFGVFVVYPLYHKQKHHSAK